MSTNTFGQPVGAPMPDWQPATWPPRREMLGRWAALEPLDPARHSEDLWAANCADREGQMWTYLPYGPFEDQEAYRTWLHEAAAMEHTLFHAIIPTSSGRAAGVAAFLRIDPPVGCIEVGHIALSPSLQHTTAATEAMALMMARVFDELGYRRYEWKCDALNGPSRAAALRLGFRYEGTFRQATVVKGRNRDTAWFSVIDGEWRTRQAAFGVWLDPANFDASGRQLHPLQR